MSCGHSTFEGCPGCAHEVRMSGAAFRGFTAERNALQAERDALKAQLAAWQSVARRLGEVVEDAMPFVTHDGRLEALQDVMDELVELEGKS